MAYRSPARPPAPTFGGGGLFRGRGLAAVAPLVLLLAGCAVPAANQGEDAPVAAAPAVPQDPLSAFVASAGPGAEAMVPVGGGMQRVRIQRTYTSARGRECRDVLIGFGSAERSTLLCKDNGGWSPAAPLLRSGGALRP